MVDLPPGEPFDEGLRRLLDHERHERLVHDRRHRHWLDAQAEESRSLRQILVALADEGATVDLWTLAGQTPGAALDEVGTDYIGVRQRDGAFAIVPVRAITSIRAQDATARSAWTRAAPAIDLVGRLAELAVDRPQVVVSSPGYVATGHLLRASAAMIVVRADPASTGAAEAEAYVATDHLAQVVVR